MRTVPKLGTSHCHGLDAWLRGEIAPPQQGEPVTETLRFVVAERFGGRAISAAKLLRRRELDDGELAHAWESAWRISKREADAPMGRRIAERIAVEQMRTLYATCLARIERIESSDMFWLDGSAAMDLRREYDLLRDTLALCLLETGDEAARQHVLHQAGARLQYCDQASSEAAEYARCVLGLSGYSVFTWHAGTGALGLLETAKQGGQMTLALARQAAPSHAPATPETDVQPAPVDTGPSLLVLASVDHLPGSMESGSAKVGRAVSTSARGEWAPYAGKRWPLVRVPDLAAARAELMAEFPYATDIVDAVLSDLAGRPHVFVRPLLLVGGPGSGKTRLARRLAEVLGLGLQVYGCAGLSDAAFGGTSRQWGSGRSSIPLQLLKRLSTASALLVLDELEKASSRKENGSILDCILPYLTDDAKRLFDPYVECNVDLSGVSYIATANDLAALRRSHPALVDRFRVYAMPAPRPQDLPVVCRTVLADLRAERALGPEWLPDLDGEELGLVAAHYDGGSLRLVRRLAETIVAGREALAVRQ